MRRRRTRRTETKRNNYEPIIIVAFTSRRNKVKEKSVPLQSRDLHRIHDRVGISC